MIVPAFSALFAVFVVDSVLSAEFSAYKGPVTCSVLFDHVGEDLVFLGRVYLFSPYFSIEFVHL